MEEAVATLREEVAKLREDVAAENNTASDEAKDDTKNSKASTEAIAKSSENVETASNRAYKEESEAKSSKVYMEAIKKLHQEVALENNGTPYEAGLGMTVEKAEIEGNYVSYYYSVDEEKVSITQLRQNKAAVKKMIKQFASGTDFAQMCIDAYKGVKYTYVGSSSGDKFVVILEPSELK